jgi:hypothetical protein
MVGGFFVKNVYNVLVSLKGAQALLESNLPAIRLMT